MLLSLCNDVCLVSFEFTRFYMRYPLTHIQSRAEVCPGPDPATQRFTDVVLLLVRGVLAVHPGAHEMLHLGVGRHPHVLEGLGQFLRHVPNPVGSLGEGHERRGSEAARISEISLYHYSFRYQKSVCGLDYVFTFP